MKRFIYADNAATTPVSEHVAQVVASVLTANYGNPSSLYSKGAEAAKIIDDSRAAVAKALGAKTNEIYFTSGGSEADNWAIKGAAIEAAKKGKKHIITSKFEHHAVLHTLAALEKQGFEVTYLDVYENGIVHPEDVEKAIRPDTFLVTIMFANNEIGTIQPIAEIAKICKEKKVLFHTDAVQAVGHVEIDVAELGVDMLSLSGHKFHAPKGVGALYIRTGVRIANLIDGGAQERGKRAGTENTASIAGLAAAICDATANIPEKCEKITRMRNKIIDGALKIERSRLNGDRDARLPGNINMCFEGIEGESLLLMLDLNGICASSGSACTSGSLDPSHVLLAIGLPHEIAHGSMRLSIDENTTDEDCDYIIEVLPKILEYLRAMSPVWEEIKNSEK
ncbi:MAG: cysteine desulfurase NifS [Clostridia bacterium]|nr:cysteine desulfurase NifS [Clostridia bacterium]